MKWYSPEHRIEKACCGMYHSCQSAQLLWCDNYTSLIQHAARYKKSSTVILPNQQELAHVTFWHNIDMHFSQSANYISMGKQFHVLQCIFWQYSSIENITTTHNITYLVLYTQETHWTDLALGWNKISCFQKFIDLSRHVASISIYCTPILHQMRID